MLRPLVLLLVLAAVCPLAAAPWEWYRPLYQGKEFVNPHLTPRRALQGRAQDRWDGQLVLWEGRVERHLSQGRGHLLLLQTEAGPVTVTYPAPARNLEYDRTGFRLAVKGALRVHQGKVAGIEGRSAILLEPPPEGSYAAFLARWSPPPPPGPYPFLCWWIRFHNPQEPGSQVAVKAAAIVEEARRQGLDPLFLAALVQIESAFDEDAVSPSGALGLGQLMPQTARELGVDPRDIRQNIQGSARMLAGLLRRWRGSPNPLASALAGYNAGPNLVARLGGQVPPYPQTTNYVYFIGYTHRRLTECATRCGVLSGARR